MWLYLLLSLPFVTLSVSISTSYYFMYFYPSHLLIYLTWSQLLPFTTQVGITVSLSVSTTCLINFGQLLLYYLNKFFFSYLFYLNHLNQLLLFISDSCYAISVYLNQLLLFISDSSYIISVYLKHLLLYSSACQSNASLLFVSEQLIIVSLLSPTAVTLTLWSQPEVCIFFCETRSQLVVIISLLYQQLVTLSLSMSTMWYVISFYFDSHCFISQPVAALFISLWTSYYFISFISNSYYFISFMSDSYYFISCTSSSCYFITVYLTSC